RATQALPTPEEPRWSAEQPLAAAEDFITDCELADSRSCCFDLSRQLGAEDPPPGPAHASEEAGNEWCSSSNAAVSPGNSRRVDLYEHLIVLRDGPFDLFESQDIRRPVPVVDNCSHEAPFPLPFGCE